MEFKKIIVNVLLLSGICTVQSTGQYIARFAKPGTLGLVLSRTGKLMIGGSQGIKNARPVLHQSIKPQAQTGLIKKSAFSSSGTRELPSFIKKRVGSENYQQRSFLGFLAAITPLWYFMSAEEKLDWYIENNKVDQLANIHCIFHFWRDLSQEQKQSCSIKILDWYVDNNKVDQLDWSIFNCFDDYLSKEQKQSYSIKILDCLVENNKVDQLDWSIFDSLYGPLSEEQKQSYSIKILDCLVENNKVDQLHWPMINRLYGPLSEEQKQSYSIKILDWLVENNKVDQLHWLTIDDLYRPLSQEQKQSCSIKILDSFVENNKVDQLDWSIINCFYDSLSEEQQQRYSSLFPLPTDWCELSSPTVEYAKKHRFNSYGILSSCLLKPEIKELCIEMIDYSGDQHEKEYVTFLHGQSWGWSLYESFYRKLEEHKKGKKISDDFIYFRYDKDTFTLSEDEAERIVKEGVKNYRSERFGILFCNLSFISNGYGSNSICYVADNHDMSLSTGRNRQEILDLFKDSGMQKAAEKVYKKRPDLFEKVQNLHDSSSEFGNFVTISFPKEQVNTYVYPTQSGGPRVKHELTDGTKTDDVKYMAEHGELLPKWTEFAIALGPDLLDPDKAKKAGIEIKQFNVANPERIRERDALIDEIIQLVVQEHERMEK